MWRCGNHAKVWYEWCTTAPQVRMQRTFVRLRVPAADALHQASLVHNANGRSYFVGL